MSSPSPERWRVIEAALEAALQTPPEERAALLERLCGEDAQLRSEMESLLAAHAQSSNFLATSAESFAAPIMLAAAAREPRDAASQLIGRYRLLEELGHGGMGTVWLAERADGQFEQQVALKLVRRGMDSEEILDRFLRERQILARLEHPHISRLLDGGVSEDGRPYFVMELVRGSAVTDYCDTHHLSIDERLRLFIITARAVGYAHRSLVVHRDIKPSNVLVDEQGTIKLLDFGIAKLLEDDDEPSQQRTGTLARLMTPEYASPEQRNGLRVTTASDIYQLGILLYELLTGRRPDTDGSGTAPRRPSTAVRLVATITRRGGIRETIEPAGVSARRGTSTERLQRRLRGDLDTIALRALRDEPDRRYPSAEDLAEDLERHLENRPIRFGGDRASYRAAKFVRRHRLSVSATVVVAMLTVGFLGFDSARVRRERDRARHEADKATEIAQLMARFLQGWSPDASDRGEVSTKKLLADAALRADRELQGRPEILSATLSILGDFHTTVGEWQAADSLLGRALAIQQHLYDRPTADLAATLARVGRLHLQTGRLAEAVTTVRQALDMHRAVYGPRHPETLRIQRELALVLRIGKKPQEAEPLLRDILASLQSGEAEPSPFALEVAGDLGYVLYQQARYDEAIAILRPTLRQQRALFGEMHVSTLYTIRMLGSALRDRGDLDEAETLYREALRVSTALFGPEHLETETAMFVLALALARKGELEEAERLARQDLSLGQRLYGAHDAAGWYRTGFLGMIRLDRGDLSGAEQLLRQALASARRTAPRDDPDLADVLNRLAYLVVRRGAPDADPLYREATSFDASRPADLADFVTDGIHFLAWAEQAKGDRAAATEDYRRALRAYRSLPSSHPYRVAAMEGLQGLEKQATAPPSP